ncbi:ATP-dependent helicase [Marinobacter salicampi]|uniref:ATP-dependent helicase n=1 Tax=Marinobacter salicampi TaxID=435907 RepID=UPI00140DEED5|nr:ATP-dependent helicase [Marinobacter salicampi]
MPTDLPDYLTDEQRAIITAGNEHVVITAVAGSGKTSTLAWRIRYLLEQGQNPSRILVLMFNRSARVDFERKLANVTQGTSLALPEVRTFHSMGLRLYRRFIREGYLPAFSEAILTEQEINFQVWLLLRRLVPEELQEEVRRSKKEYVETASGFIDRVKTTLSPADVVFEELGYEPKHRYLVDLFHSFEQWRKAESRISFADMLYEPVMAIHQNPPLQTLVANKMDLILVDEYQDTNEIQHLLLGYVAGDRARVTVVGDPDQTIYEFRGARPEFILNRFSAEYDRPLEQTLSYSFRYGHRVALLANHLISNNQGRRDVLCHAHDTTPETGISLYEHESDPTTVLSILDSLSPQARNETAILFRVWSQSVAIELQLLARQIPYRIDKGKGALFSREAEAVTALLQVTTGNLANTPESDRLTLARALLTFPHVGLKAPELAQLAGFLARFDAHWGDRLQAMDFDALTPMAGKKLKRLGEVLQQLQDFSGPVAELIRRYAEHTELYEGLRSLAMTHEAASERVDTVKGLQGYLAGLGMSGSEALAHLRSLRQEAHQHTARGGVLMSTIHRTKGLEWPTVILPGLQEKYLPYSPRQSDDVIALLESERRLLYVAITRTRHQLHLITRVSGPRPAVDTGQVPSRFIRELRFELSDQLGSQLHTLASTAPKPASLELAVAPSPVSERYAKRAGVVITLTGSAETDSEAGNAGEHGMVWSHGRLNHAVFGHGKVIREEESSFEVSFDTGQTLNFSKQTAHLYFKPVSGQY